MTCDFTNRTPSPTCTCGHKKYMHENGYRTNGEQCLEDLEIGEETNKYECNCKQFIKKEEENATR